MNETEDWYLNNHIDWMRRIFKPRIRPEVIFRKESQDKIKLVEALKRNNLGAISTWRVRHKYYPSGSLLISLDDLDRIRNWLRTEREAYRKFKMRYETSELERSIKQDKHERYSHRLTLQWLKHPRDGSLTVRLLQILDFSFSEICLEKGKPDFDREVKEFVQGLAGSVAEWKAQTDKVWEEVIREKNWEDWLKRAIPLYFRDEEIEVFVIRRG